MSDNRDVLYAEIGRRVFEAREKKKLTQDQLASLVSLSRTSITNIEKGNQRLLVHTLVDLANALDTKPEFFLSRTKTTEGGKESNKYLEDASEDAREFAVSVLKSSKRSK